MNTTLLAVTSIVLSVAAQFCLKAGMSGGAIQAAMAQPGLWPAVSAVLCNRYIVGGFVLYGLGAVVWLSVLSDWEVSRAYPLVGLGFVLTALVGSLLGEQVTTQRLLGIALITAGVILMGRA
jgi:multidrug transporter EmrE-like cation transporter